MSIDWSHFAIDQLREILLTIAIECSFEDAIRWNDKINADLESLADLPRLGRPVRPEIFKEPPILVSRIRETFSGPYRILYETAENVCRILSITHARQMVDGATLVWDK